MFAAGRKIAKRIEYNDEVGRICKTWFFNYIFHASGFEGK